MMRAVLLKQPLVHEVVINHDTPFFGFFKSHQLHKNLYQTWKYPVNMYKCLLSLHFVYKVQKYGDWVLWLNTLKGVARTIITTGHMKHHVKMTSSQVLSKIVEVLECKQCKRYAVHNIGCFVFKYFLGLHIMPSFKHSKWVFTLNQLVQVPRLLHVKLSSYMYSTFFTGIPHVNIQQHSQS